MTTQYELVVSLKQEALIDKKYKQDLLVKRKEIKEMEKKNNKLHKYTANYYIQKEPEIIIVCDGVSKTFLLINNES